MSGNAVREVGTCKHLGKLSIQDGPLETVEYMWVNIQCMLDCSAKNPECMEATVMGNCQTISCTFYSPIYPVDEGNEDVGQVSEITSYCFFVW